MVRNLFCRMQLGLDFIISYKLLIYFWKKVINFSIISYSLHTYCPFMQIFINIYIYVVHHYYAKNSKDIDLSKSTIVYRNIPVETTTIMHVKCP